MAAVEVGVRGRRREREVTEENEDTRTSSLLETPPTVKRRNRGGIVERNSAGASETSVVIVRRRDSPVEEQFQIPIDRASVSCCSSTNRFEEKSKRRIEFVDFEEDNDKDQTGTSWIYDNLNKSSDKEESVNMDSDQASEAVESRRRIMMKKKTVKEEELEDFFQAAEKIPRNKMLECSMKYNFDFEKDEPLGGRYEWVKLNP